MSQDTLPAGWARTTLGDVVSVRYGKGLPSGDRTEDGFPYVASAGVVAHSREALVAEDALIIGRKGNVGSVRVIQGGSWPSDTTFYLTPPAGLDIRFLALQLASRELHQGDQSTAIPGLPRDYLEAVSLTVPPEPEQQRIVAELERRLSHVDAAVQGLRRSLALVASARSATLNRTFASAHQVPDAEGTWPVHRMGEVFEVSVGSTPRRDSPALWDGDVPWVSSGEVAWCRIQATRESISPTAGLRVHPPGTVMLGMIGEGKTRGQAAVLDIEASHNQNCASIRVSDTEHIPEWIYYQLMAHYSRTRAAGSGNNQQALNKKLVQSMEVVLPPPDVQRKLVAALDRQMSLLDSAQRTVERQLARCEQARRSILNAAFRGELVAQDPDDEPAADLLDRIRKEHETTKTTTGRTRRKREART